MAPWKTTEAPAQRTVRRCPHLMVSTSSPSSRICPVMRAVAGNSRSNARATVDLPLPDSPANPKVLPGSKNRSAPRTAGMS